jgi:hypothetical protein
MSNSQITQRRYDLPRRRNIMAKHLRPKVPYILTALTLVWMIALAGAFNISSAQTTTKKTSTAKSRPASIPVGTEMRIRLENDIDSSKAENGDRFTAIVLSPQKYTDSTIEGHVAKINKSGKMKGQTQVSLAFDRLRTPSGRTIPMAAQLVRVYDGKGVKEVDEEGTAKSGSQGKETAVRTGGGAALGAIIGGIAGGGKGAAIGAAVGGGAGVASTQITGSKKVKLESGSEVLIRTTR